MERLLSNIHNQTSVLWMLIAISRISTQHQLNALDPTHTHPMDYANCKPYLLDPTKYNSNNSLLASYVTSPYNPAFEIHPKLPDHHQKCHQYKSLLAYYATSPYNPTFDIHPTISDHCQKCHQHHPCFPLAPLIQVLAQNKRPP